MKNKIKLTCLMIAMTGVFTISPISITDAEASAIGIRNNNPGNIRPGGGFLGENGVNGGFVTFESPEMGIRASARNLLTYQEKHGLNTVNDIIGRWAPGFENEATVSGNYQQYVANALGVSPDAQIDLRDPATLEKLTTAVIAFENGGSPYDASVIKNGVNAALDTPVAQRAGGAGSSGGVATSIVMPQYSPEQLRAAGCDEAVWNSMLNKYVGEAQRHVAVANQMQVQNQVLATPELVTQCFDQAVQIINTATKAFNSIMSFLSGGGMDSGMLKDYAKKVIINEACSQVQSYVYQTGIGSMVSQGSGMVDSMLSGDIFGSIGNVGNTPINAGDILNNSGFKPGEGGVIPTLNSNDIVGGVNNAITGPTNSSSSNSGGFWNSINPFK